MNWKQEYELGIPVVDTQHKQLFRFNEELQDAIKGGLKVSSINTLLTQIKQYAARHFAMEEKYMEEVRYPQMQEQKDTHAAFAIRFDEIQDAFNAKGMTPALVQAITNELIKWIVDHVTGMDQAFGDYYRKHSSDAT